MKRLYHKLLIIAIIWLLSFSGEKKSNIIDFSDNFAQGYRQLNIPELTYDYREYFNSIPSQEAIEKQEKFFRAKRNALGHIKRSELRFIDKLLYDHILYEIEYNLERVTLEKTWTASERKIPVGGLDELISNDRWYKYFIKKFTSLEAAPEEVMTLGLKEVRRVQSEIKKIQQLSGYDSIRFYLELEDDKFLIKNKTDLNKAFAATDSTIRAHLSQFIGSVDIPPVFPMEWPDAGPNTPPGMYLNKSYNPYGKDVFQYSFYGNKFNHRAIGWLYMHEAIPGHHLQASIREQLDTDPLQELFIYPGNFEGWACYVEYYGDELGVYRDLYSRLGKWEWDLVRSVRVVLDVGIHFKGWTREEALEYWRKIIPWQDEIAEREVDRVTNWAGQVLSYKLGANSIEQLKEKMKNEMGEEFELIRFNRTYLSFGMRPLEVIEKNFIEAYNQNKYD